MPARPEAYGHQSTIYKVGIQRKKQCYCLPRSRCTVAPTRTIRSILSATAPASARPLAKRADPRRHVRAAGDSPDGQAQWRPRPRCRSGGLNLRQQLQNGRAVSQKPAPAPPSKRAAQCPRQDEAREGNSGTSGTSKATAAILRERSARIEQAQDVTVCVCCVWSRSVHRRRAAYLRES